MVVIDHFDEWLDFATLLHPFFAHATCDFCGISFDACDQSIGERMLLCACVHRLYYHDLNERIVSLLVQSSRLIESYCSNYDRTFLPAYLPRVMMATRPTLRTGMGG